MQRSTSDVQSPLKLFRFSLLSGVSHAISTRYGGVSPIPYASLNLGRSTGDAPEHVDVNRRILFDSMGIESSDVAIARLSHGREVSIFRAADASFRQVRSCEHERRVHSDAVVSDVPGLHVLLTFADCVPLLDWDPQRNVVGAAHAGWRGTALRIGEAVVRTMGTAFGSNPADLVAGIGPSIGPCCYEIGSHVTDAFAASASDPVLVRHRNRTHLDLWETNASQLRASGLQDAAIERAGVCTACQVDTFFSHRAEAGKTGRFALCAGLG